MITGTIILGLSIAATIAYLLWDAKQNRKPIVIGTAKRIYESEQDWYDVSVVRVGEKQSKCIIYRTSVSREKMLFEYIVLKNKELR